MRFVLANILLFFSLSGIILYQYFFQKPFENSQIAMRNGLRNPAALNTNLVSPSVENALKSKNIPALDWKYSLNCKDVENAMDRSENSLILNLKKCEKEFPKEIIVENETNGFTASLFALNSSQSKTDSIPLKKGKNLIVIKYRLAKANKEAKSEIVEKLSIQHWSPLTLSVKIGDL